MINCILGCFLCSRICCVFSQYFVFSNHSVFLMRSLVLEQFQVVQRGWGSTWTVSSFDHSNVTRKWAFHVCMYVCTRWSSGDWMHRTNLACYVIEFKGKLASCKSCLVHPRPVQVPIHISAELGSLVACRRDEQEHICHIHMHTHPPTHKHTSLN